MSPRGDIAAALGRLERHIWAEGFRGYDPYDALQSPVFSLPLIRSQRRVRWGAQQVLRRLPVNIRPLLGIPRGRNPVTLGLCLQGYVELAGRQRSAALDRRIAECLRGLRETQSQGYHGSCWGYDFDWEARYSSIPAGVPTVVASGMITNALFRYHGLAGDPGARQMCLSSADFVLHDLRRSADGDSYCLSYSPLDTQKVLNATMMGARILAQAFTLGGSEVHRAEARRTVEYVMRRQREDGAWPYASGDRRTWVDGFHTGYVLECLMEYMDRTGDNQFRPHFEKGVRYYLSSFFEGEIPRYYDTSTYPVDCTAAGEAILTLIRIGEESLAGRVAAYMVRNMQDEEGFFYYRKHRFCQNTIPYMRWSNAWMFLALATLAARRGDLPVLDEGEGSAGG